MLHRLPIIRRTAKLWPVDLSDEDAEGRYFRIKREIEAATGVTLSADKMNHLFEVLETTSMARATGDPVRSAAPCECRGPD